MSTGRRREGPRLTVIYWRDIPAQVRAVSGRDRAGAPLPDRFMIAVDRAAMIADKKKVDEYVAEWREETRDCGPDLDSEVKLEVERLTAAFPQAVIRAMIRNGGWASEKPPGVNGSP